MPRYKTPELPTDIAAMQTQEEIAAAVQAIESSGEFDRQMAIRDAAQAAMHAIIDRKHALTRRLAEVLSAQLSAAQKGG